jgi:hypothetical protein
MDLFRRRKGNNSNESVLPTHSSDIALKVVATPSPNDASTSQSKPQAAKNSLKLNTTDLPQQGSFGIKVSRSPDEISPPIVPSSSGAEASSPPLNDPINSQNLTKSPEVRTTTLELPHSKKEQAGCGYVNGIWPILPRWNRRWDKPP